jgi:hypothetical protein
MNIYINQTDYLTKNFSDLNEHELDGAKHEAHKIAQQLATSKVSDDFYQAVLGNLAGMRRGRNAAQPTDVDPNESETARKFRKLFEGARGE